MATTTSTPQNPDVAYAVEDQKRRLPFIVKRIRYREGVHDSVVPDAGSVDNPRLRDLLVALSDNMCDDVVDETLDRLSVDAWTSTTGGDEVPGDGVGPDGQPVQVNSDVEDDALGDAAQQVWDANRGPARERQTYGDALTTADGWDLVEKGKDGTWRWFPQRPEQMGCRYREDQPDVLDVAWKVWCDGGKRWRLNLYYGADSTHALGAHLERYATKGISPGGGIPEPRSFLPMPADGEDDGARPDWDRNPVFHYPQGEVGGYGRSVLTDVIPLQDALNLSLCNLITQSEETALPQRWATGVQARFDPVTGDQEPMRRSSKKAGDMLTTPSTEATFGQFDGVDMSGQISLLEGLRAEIARKGYLPAFTVSAVAGATAGASGLSLLVQEGRQVKRCKTLARDWGWVHAEKVAFILRRQGGEWAGVQAADLSPEWANPATRDEQATWELLSLKMALGVPKERLLVEGGYSPAEAQRWTEAKAADAGGRISEAGGMLGVASITQPGVPGGIGLPNSGAAVPVQPAGAAAPGVAGAGAL